MTAPVRRKLQRPVAKASPSRVAPTSLKKKASLTSIAWKESRRTPVVEIDRVGAPRVAVDGRAEEDAVLMADAAVAAIAIAAADTKNWL